MRPPICLALLALTACAHSSARHPPAPPSTPTSTSTATATSTSTATATSTPTSTPTPTPTSIPSMVGKHGVVPDAQLHGDILRRLAGAAPAPCTERPLPTAYRVPKPSRTDELGLDNLGRGIAFGIPEGTVTAGHAGASDVAVYLSYRFDPSSELGDGGYRVRIRDAATGTVRDAALGFAMMRPYVLFHDPKLPLLDGDVLQVAADVREVDDASITFPPVALRAKREAADKIVRCPLAALFHDADGDGATDVEEARLATDPGDADTDGDGLPDGSDPAPLGASPPTGTADEVWVAAMKQVVADKAKDQMLISVGDGPRLDLRGVGLRILELRTDELKAYEKRFGMRVTFTIDVKVTSSRSANVEVSFGWAGSEYEATKNASGAWSFKSTGQWVTMLE